MGRTERNGHDKSLRLAGRYRLVSKLGSGGMSVVWQGYDETLGRDVAVKVLSPRLAEDRTFRDRLRQEALAAARLCHPNITGIFDFGEAPISDRLTVPYVVMELNDGESVAARISRQGSLDWREAVTVTAEVASALATAHARGVVHRDVTPANVMLTGSGAKVVDFGISAVVGQRDAAPDGSLLGTPAYLAPERLGGASVSPATDVYALGLLLYRALTGRLPWPAENTAEALRAHLYADPEPVPDLPGLPAGVADLCLRCLAKAPADRPGAAEVARALAATVGMRPVIPPLREGERPAIPVARAVVPVSAVTSPRPVVRMRLLRLRAGLRVGSALRVGGVRSLGGGLFARRRAGRLVGLSLSRLSPSRLSPGSLSPGRLSRGNRNQLSGGRRERMPAIAALATVILLAATVLSWSARREADDAGGAQTTAAGTGAAAAGAPANRARCVIRYQVQRDSGSDFEARMTVYATEAQRPAWRVEFSYPGTQRLVPLSKAVSQQGRRVVVTGSGRARTVTLQGAYRERNLLPYTFALNGQNCRAEVLGSTSPGTVDNSVRAAVEEPPRTKRKRTHPRRATPPRKPASGRSTVPAPKHSTGFSLA
ncbi:serine/threonine-protein kinase [Actinoplanes sp. NPDC051861]|uniref:serine/threonine-protein kinase n=1 Tax=Actinoplanes sp. NPDC051861 TaxID=3155170 RepID=UPI003435128B